MKYVKNIAIHLVLFTLLTLSGFTVVHAGIITNNTQLNDPGGISNNGQTDGQLIKIDNPFKCNTTGDSSKCDLMSLVVAILNNIVMPIAAVGAVVFIILAGFKYVTAQGNATAIQKANQNLLWALIGTGVLLGAAGISKVIQNTINAFLN